MSAHAVQAGVAAHATHLPQVSPGPHASIHVQAPQGCEAGNAGLKVEYACTACGQGTRQIKLWDVLTRCSQLLALPCLALLCLPWIHPYPGMQHG